MNPLPTDTVALREALFTLRTTFSPHVPDVQRRDNGDVIIELLNTIDRLLPPPKRIVTTRWLVTYSNKAVCDDDPEVRCVHKRGLFENREDASDCARELNASGDAVCVQVHKIEPVEVPVYA